MVGAGSCGSIGLLIIGNGVEVLYDDRYVSAELFWLVPWCGARYLYSKSLANQTAFEIKSGCHGIISRWMS